ncbi:MAG: bifunctional DedA family/phosphatase PAP2 family protein [Ornithinibacter sp.]
MTHVLNGILSLHGSTVYLVVTALVFLESSALVGLVVPGETALLLGGVLASHGHVNLVALVVLAVAGAVVGDAVGYALGRHLGPRLESSRVGRRIGAERWTSARDYVQRRGAWSVFAGRWIGVMRALVPPTAGLVGMPYRRFLPANVLGGATWVVTVVLIGYAAGGSVSAAQGALGTVTVVTVVVVALIVLIAVLRRRRAGRTRHGAGVVAGSGARQDRRRRVAVLVPAVVSTVGVAVAAALADGVREGNGLAAHDVSVTQWVLDHRLPALDVAARALTFAGSEVVIGGLTVALLGYLWWRCRDRAAALLVAAAMGVSGALTLGLKALVARPRPPAEAVLGSVDTSFSFPSGHTLNTAVFLGVTVLLALYRLGLGARVRAAAATVVGALVASIGVGLSRVYLGYHWLTDVLASGAIAVAIIAVAAGTAYQLFSSGPPRQVGAEAPRSVRRATPAGESIGAGERVARAR